MRDLNLIQAENRTLPLNKEGHIVSPLYVNPSSPYLEQWRDYLGNTPESKRPLWLVADLRKMRGRRYEESQRPKT